MYTSFNNETVTVSYFRSSERLMEQQKACVSSPFVFATSFRLVGFGCHLFLIAILPNKKKARHANLENTSLLYSSWGLGSEIDPTLVIVAAALRHYPTYHLYWECLFLTVACLCQNIFRNATGCTEK